MGSHFEDVQKFRQSLTPETDRGCALLAASYIDEQLKSLICATLVKSDKVQKRICSAHGPLSTFSARIDFAYLLGLIGPKAHRDLHLIRDIRNRFGHSAEPLSFTDPEIEKLCKKFWHDGGVKALASRRKFVRIVLELLAPIHARQSCAKSRKEAEDFSIAPSKSDEFLKLIDELHAAIRESRAGTENA
jgi:DNA-binding MltR family transcriptional regulator